MKGMQASSITRKSVVFFIAIAVLAFPALSFAQHFDYTFEGRLQAKLSSHLQNMGNPSPVDLSNVQVRVVRAKGSKLRGKTADTVTGPNGHFKITKKFAKNRSGFGVPGKKDIRFNIDVRFRNNSLKIRKGGWGKVNWHTIARVRDQNGGTNNVGSRIFGAHTHRELNKDLAVKHAQIFWIYQKAIQKFESEGIGFPSRVTVTYPHKNIFMKKDKGFAVNNAFLGQDDHPGNRDEPRTMMHELIHVWHAQHLPGNATIKCIFDGHHNDPDKLFPSRCSGFTEGLAEALGRELSYELFGKPKPVPETMEALREAKAGKSYALNDIQDAQRSDLGWENFFLFVMRSNEWAVFDSVNSSAVSCNPGNVSVYEILSVLKQENPRPGQITFASFTNMLDQRAGLTKANAAIYELLGDPAMTAQQVINRQCGGSATATGTLTPPKGTDPDKIETGAGDFDVSEPSLDPAAKYTGKWDTNFGQLKLYQVKDYVIGDYADNGVMLGNLSGKCLSGVFTNGDQTGIFRFHLTGDNKFKGQWAWHGEKLSGKWKGTRTAETVSSFQNFDRDGKSIQKSENQRKVYDGIYQSEYGKLELISRDRFLIGDYGSKGIIAGMWTDNGFEGVFTNKDRAGWFDWEFFSKSGNFREGSWGWIGEGRQGNWSMNGVNSKTPRLENMTHPVSCN